MERVIFTNGAQHGDERENVVSVSRHENGFHHYKSRDCVRLIIRSLNTGTEQYVLVELTKEWLITFLKRVKIQAFTFAGKYT